MTTSFASWSKAQAPNKSKERAVTFNRGVRFSVWEPLEQASLGFGWFVVQLYESPWNSIHNL